MSTELYLSENHLAEIRSRLGSAAAADHALILPDALALLADAERARARIAAYEAHLSVVGEAHGEWEEEKNRFTARVVDLEDALRDLLAAADAANDEKRQEIVHRAEGAVGIRPKAPG